MKMNKKYKIIVLCIIGTITLVGGFFVWYKYYSGKTIITPDISTPKGWIGNKDKNDNGTSHFVFVKEMMPDEKNKFITAQIVVDERRMDRPLEAWIRGYVDNNPAFTHIAFDPLQTWSSVNGHLVLVMEEKNTSSLSFHVFNNNIVYVFWFSPFGRWDEQEHFIYNENDLKIVQEMITDFAGKL